MKSPRSMKVVHKLTGCVAALGRFMSKFANKCFIEVEEFFNKFKECLASLPKLVSPIQGETLALYVSNHGTYYLLRSWVQNLVRFLRITTDSWASK